MKALLMKNILTLLILALFLLGALGCETTENLVNVTETSTGTLQGEVESIDGVLVQVSLFKDEQLVTQTETEGSFELNQIEPGDYTLHISADGYQETKHQVTIVAGQTVSLDKITLGLLPGEGLSIGTKAPDFELPDSNGVLYSLSDYIGQDKKVVLVFYRAGW